MKLKWMRTVELSLLVLLLLACVGAVSSIDFRSRLDRKVIPAAGELQNRFLEYLNSPTYP